MCSDTDIPRYSHEKNHFAEYSHSVTNASEQQVLTVKMIKERIIISQTRKHVMSLKHFQIICWSQKHFYQLTAVIDKLNLKTIVTQHLNHVHQELYMKVHSTTVRCHQLTHAYYNHR